MTCLNDETLQLNDHYLIGDFLRRLFVYIWQQQQQQQLQQQQQQQQQRSKNTKHSTMMNTIDDIGIRHEVIVRIF